ncbi:TPA: Glu-tRNA(Gln) amidotransferase subunit GatE [Candidatus Woesearchaeota archaeon]|nr:Glu-tRNA(Gln) amidotransferase subunit GatE [Candidatus Woesearchaeota archaeon]
MGAKGDVVTGGVVAVDTTTKVADQSSVEAVYPVIPGLKVGLEIHQQLGNATTKNRKLFCACTADIVERQPDVVFSRQLRAIAGETGIIDIAAAAEQAKGKRYLYHAFQEASCLVEMDEEPPHPVNQEAMTTGVMVAKAFGSTILPRVQFMRKTVVDGSAVSGFQRTGLLALGGTIPGLDPAVRIQTVCVEEDASQIIERGANHDSYNLSRLGIPLIEVATEPDITSPQQAQDAASQIGMVLRSTRRVKRGLGTIRQDVNVSVPGGNRVEIKGCQDLRLLKTYVEYEARRQLSLLALKNDVGSRVRKADIATISSGDIIDVTAVFAQSKTGFIKSAITKGDAALGIKVPGMRGLFGRELCPGYRFGSELADLARARGFGGLIHSDEDLGKYGVGDHKGALASMFGIEGPDAAASHDAFIILLGKPDRVAALIDDLIIPRLTQMFDGVQKEVRKPNPDGTTSFQRPMPGAARMYPETDIPLVIVDASSVSAPKLLTEQIADAVANAGISEDQARQIVREGLPFDEWRERFPSVDPTFLATAIITFGKEIAARYKKEIDHIALLEPLLSAVERKLLDKSSVFQALVDIAEGKAAPGSIDYSRYAQLSDEDLAAIVREEIAKNPALPAGGLMGNVMARVRGKADGKRVQEIIARARG